MRERINCLLTDMNEEEEEKQKNSSVLYPAMLNSPDTVFAGSIYGNVPVNEQAEQTRER